MIVQCATFSKSLNPRNIDKSVSDIRIRIRFPFESSLWISVSSCELTILPDIQPANRIVIISDLYLVWQAVLPTGIYIYIYTKFEKFEKFGILSKCLVYNFLIWYTRWVNALKTTSTHSHCPFLFQESERPDLRPDETSHQWMPEVQEGQLQVHLD